jgi:hypothetical protein
MAHMRGMWSLGSGIHSRRAYSSAKTVATHKAMPEMRIIIDRWRLAKMIWKYHMAPKRVKC